MASLDVIIPFRSYRHIPKGLRLQVRVGATYNHIMRPVHEWGCSGALTWIENDKLAECSVVISLHNAVAR